MRPQSKLFLCLLGNGFVFTTVGLFTLLYGHPTRSLQIGYHSGLSVLYVPIDNMEKYSMLLLLIALINWSKVIVENVAVPILQFSIYNPDKKIITEFTYAELQFYSNMLYLLTNLRRLLLTLISISQIDLALWSILTGQLSSAYIVYTLLREKTFQKQGGSGINFISE
jgi:hypothetical protein